MHATPTVNPTLGVQTPGVAAERRRRAKGPDGGATRGGWDASEAGRGWADGIPGRSAGHRPKRRAPVGAMR